MPIDLAALAKRKGIRRNVVVIPIGPRKSLEAEIRRIASDVVPDGHSGSACRAGRRRDDRKGSAHLGRVRVVRRDAGLPPPFARLMNTAERMIEKRTEPRERSPRRSVDRARNAARRHRRRGAVREHRAVDRDRGAAQCRAHHGPDRRGCEAGRTAAARPRHARGVDEEDRRRLRFRIRWAKRRAAARRATRPPSGRPIWNSIRQVNADITEYDWMLLARRAGARQSDREISDVSAVALGPARQAVPLGPAPGRGSVRRTPRRAAVVPLSRRGRHSDRLRISTWRCSSSTPPP